MQIGSLSRIFKVLAVPTRLRIVRLLKDHPLCVNALASRLRLTQGAVSQHLRIMREAGLVIPEKRGYYVHYRLNDTTVQAWRLQIDSLLARRATPKKRVARSGLEARFKEDEYDEPV